MLYNVLQLLAFMVATKMTTSTNKPKPKKIHNVVFSFFSFLYTNYYYFSLPGMSVVFPAGYLGTTRQSTCVSFLIFINLLFTLLFYLFGRELCRRLLNIIHFYNNPDLLRLGMMMSFHRYPWQQNRSVAAVCCIL